MTSSSSTESRNQVRTVSSSSNVPTADDASTAGEHERYRGDLLQELELFLKEANTTENLDSAFATVYISEPGESAEAFGGDAVEGALKKVDEFIYEVRAEFL